MLELAVDVEPGLALMRGHLLQSKQWMIVALMSWSTQVAPVQVKQPEIALVVE